MSPVNRFLLWQSRQNLQYSDEMKDVLLDATMLTAHAHRQKDVDF